MLSIRRRFQLAYLALAGVLVPVGYVTARALEATPPKPLAPQAVALVERYLQTLHDGDRSAACRIVDLPSLCTTRASVVVDRYTVSPAQPTVDGVQVRATIDDEDALFLLAPARHGAYRIVDVVADSASVPTLIGPG
jgi:hypothetical protein